jgi:hypothetical protein
MALDTLDFFGEEPLKNRKLAVSPLTDGTPIEKVEGWDNLWVKREDLSCPFPGPCFSKIRGVYSRIASRPEQVIGVLDTYHSKAGWAVSYICSLFGKTALNFYPRYKGDGPELRQQQEMSLSFGSELVALPAGRSAILYHSAKKETERRGGYMMPNALKLHETVEECAAEVEKTEGLEAFQHLVISISSATIATGVLKGFSNRGLRPHVWLHMGYDRSQEEIQRYMLKHHETGFPFPISFINENYGYKDQARAGFTPPPFPCNPYYDLKAWRWMEKEGKEKMAGNILFWNIGS